MLLIIEGFFEKRNYERKCVVLFEKFYENVRMEEDIFLFLFFMSWILFKFGWIKIIKSIFVNVDVKFNC